MGICVQIHTLYVCVWPACPYMGLEEGSKNGGDSCEYLYRFILFAHITCVRMAGTLGERRLYLVQSTLYWLNSAFYHKIVVAVNALSARVTEGVPINNTLS